MQETKYKRQKSPVGNVVAGRQGFQTRQEGSGVTQRHQAEQGPCNYCTGSCLPKSCFGLHKVVVDYPQCAEV